MQQQIMYNMEVTGSLFLIIKWEGFPALIGLIGLITFTDFINRFEVSDNRFQNLSRFLALIYNIYNCNITRA